MLVLLALAGCGPAAIQLDDTQNYTYAVDFAASVQEIKPEWDCTVDWSGLTTDLQDHDVDPAADISMVTIARFKDDMTKEDVLDAIAANNLEMAVVDGSAEYAPVAGETSAPFSDFSLWGSPIEPETEVLDDGKLFLAGALTGLYHYRMFAFFDPTTGADETTISVTSDSAGLDFEVDVGSGERIPKKRGSSVVVNWSSLTTDGLGNTFEVANIDRLVLGRYDLTPEEVEADFFNLETIATRMFEADVEMLGEYDLGDLTDQDGAPFEGFEGDGVWILALMCSTCTNPAPLFLSLFE